MFNSIGWPEILLLMVVALLLFGAKRLPEIGRSMGKGMREFKDSLTGREDDDRPELTAAAEDRVSAPPVRERDTVG
jgi:sec-independent protein translocase protein TatA